MSNDFDIKEERNLIRWMIIKSFGIAGLLAAMLFIGLFLITDNVKAAPVAEAQGPGVVVTLTDEACRIAEVSNLKLRATWTENGKTTEGCFAVTQGMALFYFLDRTVVVIPSGMFQRVTSL